MADLNYLSIVNRVRHLTSEEYEILRLISHLYKNLKNCALYKLKQAYQNNQKIPTYEEIYHALKTGNDYQEVHSQCGQQIIKEACQDFASFLALMEMYNKKQLKHKPKMPHYLPTEGFTTINFAKQSFSIRGNFVLLSLPLQFKLAYGIKNIRLPLPPQVNKKNAVMFKLIPRNNSKYFELVCVYDDTKQRIIKTVTENKDITLVKKEVNNKQAIQDKILVMDLGVSNFATFIDTVKNMANIIDGRFLKSINQEYNKFKAAAQKLMPYKMFKKKTKDEKVEESWGQIRWSIKMENIRNRRKCRMKDSLHKASKRIIDHCLKHGIDKIIIGHNKNWKQEINIGKTNNQNQCMLPHSQFIAYLKYKGERNGIEVIEQEEAHTSKCDALALEAVQHHQSYLGKRVLRGLFRSSTGKVINADVNGALNILRKYYASIGDKCKGDSLVTKIVNSGLVFRPVRGLIHSNKKTLVPFVASLFTHPKYFMMSS